MIFTPSTLLVITLFPMVSLMLLNYHLLSILLLMEILTLMLIISLSTTHYNSMFMNMANILILLTIGAIEASVGLACLVTMLRTHGTDKMKSLSNLKM